MHHLLPLCSRNNLLKKMVTEHVRLQFQMMVLSVSGQQSFLDLRVNSKTLDFRQLSASFYCPQEAKQTNSTELMLFVAPECQQVTSPVLHPPGAIMVHLQKHAE